MQKHLIERIKPLFWKNVVKTETCWLYQKHLVKGYGQLLHGKRPRRTMIAAHRDVHGAESPEVIDEGSAE